MPKLNKFLVTSIIADIRECVYVSNEIYSWIGDIEHLSWKFPTKIAKDINAMEIVMEHNGTAGEFYILLLELAYDRIQFVLRLIVEFMDKYPFVDDFFKEVTCVDRSEQISLASLLRLIWDRLRTIPDSISRCMVKSNKIDGQSSLADRVSQSSQASSSVNYCESCEVAGSTILRTIDAIERAFAESKLISAAAAARDECRSDIYKRTQWAAMTKLAAGIETDVETAVGMAAESNLRARTAMRDHDETIQKLRVNLMIQEKRSDALLSEKQELNELLKNAREELERAERKNAALNQAKRVLGETVEETRIRASMLAAQNSVLQSQAVTLAESKLETEKTVIGLRKEIIDARDAYLSSEQHLRALLNESREKSDTLQEQHDRKVEALEKEIESLRLLIANKNEKKKARSMNENGTVEGIREGTIIKPEDDPVADMTQQLMSNREKIEVLSRQNERLSRTLSRLQQYRVPG